MTEKTCNEFVREMADVGFDFTFTATNGEIVIRGECKGGIVKSAQQLSPQDQKNRILNILAK